MTDAAQTQQKRVSEREKQGTADIADPFRNELIAVAICSEPVEKLTFRVCWADLRIAGLQSVVEAMEEEQQVALRSMDLNVEISEDALSELAQQRAKIEREIGELKAAREETSLRGNVTGELGRWMNTKTEPNAHTHGEEMRSVIERFGSPISVEFKRVAPLRKAVAKSDRGMSFTDKYQPITITFMSPAPFGAFLSYQYYSAGKAVSELETTIQGVQNRIDYAQTTPTEGNPPPPGWRPDDKVDSLNEQRGRLQHEKERVQELLEAIENEEKFQEFDRDHRAEMRIYTGAASVGVIIIEQVFSLALNFVPVVGEVASLQQAVTGVDLITGDRLGGGSRLLALVGALPMVGWLSKAGKEVKSLAVVDRALVYAADGRVAVSAAESEVDALARKILAAPGGENSVLRAYLSEEMTAKIMNVARQNEKPLQVIRVIADEKAAGVWIAQDGGALLIKLEKGSKSKKTAQVIVTLDEAVKFVAKTTKKDVTLGQAIEFLAKTAEKDVQPDLEGFQRALKEAYDSLPLETGRRIKGFELSGKSAGVLFEAGGSLRDVDILVLSDDEAAIMDLFRRTEQKYRAITGTGGSLFDSKIVLWKGWRKACDPEAQKEIDKVGGAVRAAYEAVESKALVRFVGEKVVKTNLDNAMLLRQEQLTLDEIWRAAQEAAEKIEKIRQGKLPGETEAKFVGKLSKLVRAAENEGLIPRLSDEYEEIASKALREQIADVLRKEGVIFDIPGEFRLSAKEADMFVSNWSRIGPGTRYAVFCRFFSYFARERRNAIRTFLEAGLDPKYIVPVENTARLVNIAQALKQADDFTEWWAELTEEDVDQVLESLSLMQEDSEFLKAFTDYTVGESETEEEYEFSTPFRPMVTH